MVRRHARSHVAPSAYVFPGGTARPDDREPFPPAWTGPGELSTALSARSDEPVASEGAAAIFVAAIRELFEEAGVLLTHEGDQVRRRAGSGSPEVEQARDELNAGRLSLARLMQGWGVEPAFDELVPFSHWVTPVLRTARFDTWFFVAAMPSDQEAVHCNVETTDGAWLAPTAALADAAAGRIEMVFATRMQLARMAQRGSVEELLRFARTKPIRRILPRLTSAEAIEPDAAEQAVLGIDW